MEINDKSLLKILEKDLDAGEAACIAIAVNEKYDLVLLDEQEARETAEIYELKKTGIIGILLGAKTEGKIANLKDALDRLIENANFWINRKLYTQVLKEAGEL